MTKLVTAEREGLVETLHLANPPLNLIGNELLGALYEELVRVRGDSAVRALVLTGGIPGSFLTHYDISESLAYSRLGRRRSAFMTRLVARLTHWLMRKANRHAWLDRMIVRSLARRTAAERGSYYWVRCLDLLDTMPKPVIAAINGVCLGGGCELALCCDLRLMAEGPLHRIGLPEILVGILPGGTGTTWRLPRIIGEAGAAEMLLTGRSYAPQEAASLRLIHEVVPPEELLARAAKLAHRLASCAPVTMAALRDALRRGSRLPPRPGRVVDLAAINVAMATDDARSGLLWYLQDVLGEGPPPELSRYVADLTELMERGEVPVKYEGR